MQNLRPVNAYAFGAMDTIAGIAAAVMFILGGLGLMHARRTSPTAELLPAPREAAPVPSSANTNAWRRKCA